MKKARQLLKRFLTFLKTVEGRKWTQRALIFLVILLGLRWAIASGVEIGVERGTYEIEKELNDIQLEISELHQSYLWHDLGK